MATCNCWLCGLLDGLSAVSALSFLLLVDNAIRVQDPDRPDAVNAQTLVGPDAGGSAADSAARDCMGGVHLWGQGV